MARRKDEQSSSQFDTGFGAGGTFGGTSGGGSPKSQAQMGGEFSSGFGGGTNAVSQIFNGGGGGQDDKRRKMTYMVIMGAVGFIIVGAGYFLLFDDSLSTEPAPETAVVTPAAKPTTDAGAKPTTEAIPGAAVTDATEEEATEEDEETEEDGEELATDAVAPSSSASYTYNENGGGPIVQAAAGTGIEVSRKADFSEMYISGTTNAGGQLRIPNPPPGKIYWRVAGKTEVTEITVAAAPKLNIAMKIGASIGASETLQWSADGEAAHFRLEFASDAAFTSIAHSFSTNKSQLALSGVNPGNYFVRVGGLNVAAGRWEFTRGSSVEVK
ncbi:MAG: hypothetical protein RLZZ488_2150 [Pseudomonadota bacterium]|jgi:hypothetical protein